MRERRPMLAVAAAVVLAALALAAVWTVGSRGTAPAPRPVGLPPEELPAEDVVFGPPDAPVRGWLVRGRAGAPAIVLLHGVRADRRMMLGRAGFLHAAGYTALLFDFQAHGESPGEAITFGYRESRNVGDAVAFLRGAVPGVKIGLIGVSLGGASAVLARPLVAVDAMVLEAVYPTIEDAIGDRVALRLGGWARRLTPLFLWQFKPRLGFTSAELRPIERIGAVTVPKLMIAGTADRHTTIAESEALFAAAAQPAEFWAIEGAAHVDFHAFVGAAYETRILGFFARTLR
jgi:fermentation-respiration switch protein FrsA (DUF1100 family)